MAVIVIVLIILIVISLGFDAVTKGRGDGDYHQDQSRLELVRGARHCVGWFSHTFRRKTSHMADQVTTLVPHWLLVWPGFAAIIDIPTARRTR